MTNIEGLSFSAEELLLAVEDGRVTRRHHDYYPYSIYNYSDEVTFSNHWDKITRACRGLILKDSDFSIVARPWEKFFNLGQMAMEIQPDDPCEVMDKADGSLGILYPLPSGSYAISTRGSFHSEQAEHATGVWNDFYKDFNKAVQQSGMTYLFEIIYPENQIVLDYGDTDDLMLLGAVQTATGYYYGPREAKAFIGWDGPVVEVFPYKSISEALAHTDRDNAEGFVLRSHNYLVKIKQPDYIDKHRLRFHMTPKNIWAELVAGTDLVDMVKILPDEFQQVILEIGNKIIKDYVAIAMEISIEWEQVKHIKDRKELAAAVQDKKHRAALFSIADNKDYSAYIWKLVKPKKDDLEG